MHAKTSKSQLTNETIKKSEESKKEAEQNKATLESGLTDIKSMVKSLEAAKADLDAYVQKLDETVEKINSNVEYFNKQIAQKEKELAQTEEKLTEAEAVADEQYEAMKKRVKFMYERGETSYIESLAEARDFAELLNRAEFIRRLSEYDRNMLEQFIATRDFISEQKEEIIRQEAALEADKLKLENEKAAMETLIAEKQKEIDKYEADIAKKQAAINEYEAEIAAQTALIQEYEKIIAQERKRLEEQKRKAIVYDGGKFKWPAPSYTRISDDYGWRVHPILGVKQFHNGVDMASPSGSPILAAYDGEVVAADYSSTMGNYVMIDHGDSLITIYMHASSVSVGKGQSVKRGEQIGKVGSTGRSTGPHLHFTVRLNGDYVSPWKYLSK